MKKNYKHEPCFKGNFQNAPIQYKNEIIVHLFMRNLNA